MARVVVNTTIRLYIDQDRIAQWLEHPPRVGRSLVQTQVWSYIFRGHLISDSNSLCDFWLNHPSFALVAPSPTFPNVADPLVLISLRHNLLFHHNRHVFVQLNAQLHQTQLIQLHNMVWRDAGISPRTGRLAHCIRHQHVAHIVISPYRNSAGRTRSLAA